MMTRSTLLDRLPDVSVIIPTYKDWDRLKVCVKALQKQSYPIEKIEIIIINNDSSPVETRGFFSDIAVSVRIIEEPVQGSYSARNKGLEFSEAELIIFTDADCKPDNDWVASLYKAYKKSDRKTLLAGNVIINSQSKKPSTAELYDIAVGLPQERYVARGYAVTANLAIPRVVFDEIGFFDEQRFSGGDADFCQRAIKAGFSLKYIPEAVVYHPARKTWDEHVIKVRRVKGGQISAGRLSRRVKYFFITLLPPVWRLWRTIKSEKLKFIEKLRVVWFQLCLWGVELLEMIALLAGKKPERR